MKDNFMNENGMATEWMNVENRAFRICFGNTGEWNKGLCEFGRKLLCAADLLSAGEFLGLELSVDSEGNCGGYVFSNAKEGMTAEDCQWFFLGLADIAKIAETDGKVGKPSGEQDHVYRMSEVSASELEGNEALRQKISEMKGACARRKEQDQEDLVQMLQKTGARLFMIFNAQGMRFFVRTQSGMSLGMRTLLTFLFPGNVIEEVSGSVPAKERATFSRNSALDMTAGFLELFARRQFEKNRQTDYWDDSQDFEFTDDIDDFEIMDEADCCDISDDPDDYVPIGDPEDFGSQACSSSGADDKDQKDDGAQDGPNLDDSMTIDELELTVRSYNCLRRAGIDTIGELRQMTDEDLQHVRNLGRKGISEIRERLAQYGIQTQSRALTVVNKSSFEMLDELIGLDAVKEQVRKIVAYARMKHDMEERFLGNGTSIVLNMEFVGNPGTAKTTVARIVAGILHETGLLRYKDIVEVGRADLVAKYVGQTADKVRDAFRRAQGKVLFIDEAYSLLEEHEGSFGDEAIATIVQEMENHRRETVVIFAGYPKEMADFIGRNPGLRSRVPFRIEFQDYSAEEMAQIAEHETRGRGFCIAPEAMEKVLSICAENSGNIELGNGRFSRNLVEGAILNYAARVYGTDGADNEIQSDFVLREEDFSTQNLLETKKTVKPLGFIA